MIIILRMTILVMTMDAVMMVMVVNTCMYTKTQQAIFPALWRLPVMLPWEKVFVSQTNVILLSFELSLRKPRSYLNSWKTLVCVKLGLGVNYESKSVSQWGY